MRYLIRVVPERERWLPEIQAQIPHVEIMRDLTRNAMETFLLSLMEAGDDPAVHLEDDAQLTTGFLEKIEAAIAERPNNVIQFFSLRQSDAGLGSRWMAGRTFMMAQCFYLPAGAAADIYDFYPVWPRHREHPRSGYDMLVAAWLVSRRWKYWLHVPSLVQHRVARSVIDRRRSSKRQSPSFAP